MPRSRQRGLSARRSPTVGREVREAESVCDYEGESLHCMPGERCVLRGVGGVARRRAFGARARARQGAQLAIESRACVCLWLTLEGLRQGCGLSGRELGAACWAPSVPRYCQQESVRRIPTAIFEGRVTGRLAPPCPPAPCHGRNWV